MQTLWPKPAHTLSDQDLGSVYEWPARSVAARTVRPWWRVNFAASIDGSPVAADGVSAGVSGSADKRVFRILRATCDVVVAGAGTARAENYALPRVPPELVGLRQMAGRSGSPHLCVVTRSGDLGAAAHEWEQQPTVYVVTTKDGSARVRRDHGDRFEVIVAENTDNSGDPSVDLPRANVALAQFGFTRILCEGGPHLFSSLLRADLVDDVCLTVSPLFVGQVGGDVDAMAPPGRITAGVAFPSPVSARLAHVLLADDSLLTRWTVSHHD